MAGELLPSVRTVAESLSVNPMAVSKASLWPVADELAARARQPDLAVEQTLAVVKAVLEWDRRRMMPGILVLPASLA